MSLKECTVYMVGQDGRTYETISLSIRQVHKYLVGGAVMRKP